MLVKTKAPRVYFRAHHIKADLFLFLSEKKFMWHMYLEF